MANHLYAQIVQSAVLINAANEALILRTHEGKWQLPGGRLNEGEHWDAGLRREILEETAISDVEILSILLTDNWEFRGVKMYGVYFLCRTNATEVRTSSEHTEFRWVGKNDDLKTVEFWHENLRLMVNRGLSMARGPEI